MAAKQCVNCVSYSWVQLKEGAEEMKKCSKCKFVHYCSRQCQEEHWEKVHSAQCKFLAGRKFDKLNSHEAVSCQGCLQETFYTMSGLIPVASTALARPDNPDYGCHLPGYINILPFEVSHKDFGNGGMFSAPLPFPLGDMTGQFRTRAEHCLSLMQRNHYKLQISGHPLQDGVMIAGLGKGHQAIDFFCSILAALRAVVWNVYWRDVPGAMTDRFVANAICNFLKDQDMGGGFHALLQQLDVLNPVLQHPNSFNICDTIILLMEMALIPYHFGKTLARLHSVLPREVQELVTASDPLEKIVAKVEMVAGLLSAGLAPWVQVLKVLCDGKLEQVCSCCGSPTTISSLFTNHHSQEAAISRRKAFVTFSGVGGSIYSCGEAICSKEVIARMINTTMVLCSTTEMLEEKYGTLRCDNCFLVGRKGHRCSKCLTKLYCSKECQLEDFKVHNKVCREGEVERKRKGEKREREEEGKKDSEKKKEELIREMENKLGDSTDPAIQAVVTKVAEALGKIAI